MEGSFVRRRIFSKKIIVMTEPMSRSASLLRELIQCQSVTPQEGGALTCLERHLTALGARVSRMVFSHEATPDVENLYARIGTAQPNLCFAGHTDVVPTGDPEDWRTPPFAGAIANGSMFGRGAVDMKGGIACFLAAVESFVTDRPDFQGSISFLITGDEEGPAINGTEKLLKWTREQAEQIDACIVGEPTNPMAIGDAIKIGRRGSLSGRITVHGVQGHTAYPDLADNPVRAVIDMLDHLLAEPFDTGTKNFQPTNLEVNSVDVGNPTVNVIPAKATASFNIRFNDTWTAETVRREIERRLEAGANAHRIRQNKKTPASYEVEWIGNVSHVFLTDDQALISTLSEAVSKVTGSTPELSTGGGTSDARYIKDYCPVVEFGLVGQTMHQIDEHTSLKDLDTLTAIYRQFLDDYFE